MSNVFVLDDFRQRADAAPPQESAEALAAKAAVTEAVQHVLRGAMAAIEGVAYRSDDRIKDLLAAWWDSTAAVIDACADVQSAAELEIMTRAGAVTRS